MHKGLLEWRLVLTGFLVAIIVVLLILGLLYVSYYSRQTGIHDDRNLIELCTKAGKTTLRIINAEITFSADFYTAVQPLLQKLTVFLPGFLRALTAVSYSVGRMVYPEFSNVPAIEEAETIGSVCSLSPAAICDIFRRD